MQIDRQAFAAQFLAVVSSALPLKGCCFYRVKDGRQIIDYQLFNLQPYWQERYCHYFWRIDPLHPERMSHSHQRLQLLDWERSTSDAGAQEYYEHFLRPQNTTHQIELYFWMGSHIVAGASLLRTGAHGAFTPENIAFLDKLVQFVETSCLEEERDDPVWLGLASLTPREREIANLVGAAVCNKEIGRRLNIELPTVKTHVSRVLTKAGVRSRAELMKKLHDR